ncbi:NAD(P)H-hydrate dehydratase [Agromyces mariniharenae]|uniref:ADP-dependent (S)-NAD(P)H-hydrate dehydratase n=1 Tax=Agromyces mariniharenae TaxID=2604423 RepID=A0A5S4V8B8_9MICO|nr:NAD(P)H-hydrate dehydratase [Agromyces mariniharenae]TYL52810.1 NAD(P)H-hydrate dehydratase [Agromyces mariniharenae]
MSGRRESAPVDVALLRDWPLPAPGESKDARGRVVVVGGSARTPGAVVLAGVAALRVGAGRLTLVVPESIAAHVAIAVPEAGVIRLPDGRGALLTDDAHDELESADAVVVGPGFIEPGIALRAVAEACETITAPTGLALDAFALGVLPDLDDLVLPAETVLTPNIEEAGILLGHDVGDAAAVVGEIAGRYGAAVTCYGEIAVADGRRWHVEAGGPGLGTSGSGDVLAGAVAGLLARGADAAQAAVWATFAHAMAGDRLVTRIAPVGFLARELCDELPRALATVG